MRLVLLLITILFLLTSCQDTIIGSIPKPQPVQPDNLTPANPINNTNETEVVNSNVEVLLPREGNLTLFFLDVKGSSTLIHYDDKGALVDSGFEEDSSKVLKSIRSLGIENLDYIFATNTQPKNIGGIPYIILRTSPINIIENGIPSNSDYYTIYKELHNETIIIKQDTLFQLDKVVIKTIVGYDDGQGFSQDTNDDSVVVKVSYGNTKFLLMSDCGMECEERLKNTDLSADILKITDSCEATSLTFLQRVNPDVAIVSTQDSEFCPSIVNRFSYLDIPLYKTINGDISITTDGLDYSIGQKKQ